MFLLFKIYSELNVILALQAFVAILKKTKQLSDFKQKITLLSGRYKLSKPYNYKPHLFSMSNSYF